MLHILDLPPELLEEIVYFSILARVPPPPPGNWGFRELPLARALRLKLVCSESAKTTLAHE